MSQVAKAFVQAIRQQNHNESFQLWKQVSQQSILPRLNNAHAASMLVAIGSRKDPRYHTIVREITRHHQPIDVEKISPKNAIRIIMALQSAGDNTSLKELVERLEPVVWNAWSIEKQVLFASIVLKNNLLRNAYLNQWKHQPKGDFLQPVLAHVDIAEALEKNDFNSVVRQCVRGFQLQLWSGSMLNETVHFLISALTHHKLNGSGMDSEVHILEDELKPLFSVVGQKSDILPNEPELSAAYQTLVYFGASSMPASSTTFIKALFHPSTISKTSFQTCFNLYTSLDVAMTDAIFSILLHASMQNNHHETCQTIIKTWSSSFTPSLNIIQDVPDLRPFAIPEISMPASHALVSYYTSPSLFTPIQNAQDRNDVIQLCLSNALHILTNAKHAGRNVRTITVSCLEATCQYGLSSPHHIQNALELINEFVGMRKKSENIDDKEREKVNLCFDLVSNKVVDENLEHLKDAIRTTREKLDRLKSK